MEDKNKPIIMADEVLKLSRKSFYNKLLKVRAENSKRIGIDLSKSPYLNSEAIGILAYNYVVLHDLGTELYFIDPSPNVLKILRDTGLSKVIKIEYSPVEPD